MESNKFSFKKLFWAYFGFNTPICIITGLLALFDISGVYFNEKSMVGISGFAVSIFLIPFISLILAFTNWVALNIGQRICETVLSLTRKRNSRVKE